MFQFQFYMYIVYIFKKMFLTDIWWLNFFNKNSFCGLVFFLLSQAFLELHFSGQINGIGLTSIRLFFTQFFFYCTVKYSYSGQIGTKRKVCLQGLYSVGRYRDLKCTFGFCECSFSHPKPLHVINQFWMSINLWYKDIFFPQMLKWCQ